MTPKAAAPVVLWLFGVVWLFWLRVGLLDPVLVLGALPQAAEAAMDRNFYYIGIAFFGMINGLFNQIALLFAYLFVQMLAPALLFGSDRADADVLLADGLDRDDHPRRHSGRAL